MQQAPLSKEQRRTLRAYRSALGEFKKLNPLMTTATIDTFLQVCLSPGKAVEEYADILGAPQSTTSRHLLDLSVSSRSKTKKGYNLLLRNTHPTNVKQVVYEPSADGRKLALEVINHLPD